MLLTHSRMMKIILFFISVLTTEIAIGNPELGGVASGNVTVKTSGNTTTVNQSTDKAIIDWRSFNVQQNESVNFNQVAGGIALNRIDPSRGMSTIQGKITATGQIILVNGSGINFGPQSQVNVGSLIVSTSNISNANFLSGNLIFDLPSTNANAQVMNHGIIKAADYGLVALLGPHIKNHGLIQAQLGNVILGSGNKFTLNFSGNDLINFSIDAASDHAMILNQGNIIANGGKVIIHAKTAQAVLDNTINLHGMVQANSVASKNGEIILMSNGDMNLHGQLLAQGKDDGTNGGNIKIYANDIKIDKQVTVDASGRNKGGNITLAGYNSSNENVSLANSIEIEANGTLNATAFPKTVAANNLGIGGTISLLADKIDVDGMLLTTGSGGGGNINIKGNYISLGHKSDNPSIHNGGNDDGKGGRDNDGKDNDGNDDHNGNDDDHGKSQPTLIDASTLSSGTGGNIYIEASNDLLIEGTLSAIGKANNTTGGNIQLFANNIDFDRTMVTTYGLSGAGNIAIAGFGSRIGNLVQANKIDISKYALIKAAVLPNRLINPTNTGIGGNIDVYGQTISFSGKLIATGMTGGGNIRVVSNDFTALTPASSNSLTGYVPLMDASTIKSGKAGNITIDANSIKLNGVYSATGLFYSSAGGVINLIGNNINVDSAMVTTTSQAGGGMISIGPRTLSNPASIVNLSQNSIVEAKAIGKDGAGGWIRIDGGDVNLDGKLNVSAMQSGGFGGLTQIFGKNINLKEHLSLDASGDIGGGQVIVGANPFVFETSNTDNITMANGSVIAATGKSSTSGGGTIHIFGKNTDVNGRVDASSKGDDPASLGGRINLLANNNLHLGANANIDASAGGTGGSVFVGGNRSGNGIEANAAQTIVDAGSLINASSLTNGFGGRVIVWSREKTLFNGSILARGGAAGGDGGFVQVASQGELVNNGTADVSAPNGEAGGVIYTP